MSDPSYVASGDLTNEYFGAEMRAPLLRRIADETGGRFYTTDNVADLAKDIVFTDVGNTVVDRKDLWDMPIVFLLLLGLVTSEWGYREARGSGVRSGLAAALAAVVLAVPSARLTPCRRRPAGRARVLIVSGVAGEPQYADAFHKQATSMIDALKTRLRRSRLGHRVPGGSPVARRGAHQGRVDARRTSSASSPRSAQRSKSGDVLFVMLIGHGSGDDAAPRVQRPGARHRRVGFRARPRWRAGPGGRDRRTPRAPAAGSSRCCPVRTASIATATKSGMEKNQTRFAAYFVQAYAADVADADKDGRVSVLEAFDYARREVARAYESENHLLTEHAQLDDNGDRKGTAAPDAKTTDGGLARRVVPRRYRGQRRGGCASGLERPAGRRAGAREGLASRRSIERSGDRRPTMDSTVYQKSLETLLFSSPRRTRRFAMRREVGHETGVADSVRVLFLATVASVSCANDRPVWASQGGRRTIRRSCGARASSRAAASTTRRSTSIRNWRRGKARLGGGESPRTLLRTLVRGRQVR